jgi:hypothetical protein
LIVEINERRAEPVAGVGTRHIQVDILFVRAAATNQPLYERFTQTTRREIVRKAAVTRRYDRITGIIQEAFCFLVTKINDKEFGFVLRLSKIRRPPEKERERERESGINFIQEKDLISKVTIIK